MSRQSIKEYILDKRRVYRDASQTKKVRTLTEVCETTGYSRKYVIKLLNGTIRYRERKGRGKTYKGKTPEVLKSVWLEACCPCAPYFKADIARWIDEYVALVANVDPMIRANILKMSASTMDRALKGEVRVKPGLVKANKRSGRNNKLKASIPCHSGEEVMGCLVPPGDVQVDTFALGGGDPSENFFWILDGTDRNTQWTALSPTWNRGQHATLDALKRIETNFPFLITSLHSDNGGEIINHHLVAYLGGKRSPPYLSRSRPRRSNDNAHVEQKNRSVGRELFGERRLDNPDLLTDLIRICAEWSDFCNFFRPCKMLIAKEKRRDGKGFACRYDAPRTPYQRVLESGSLSDGDKAALKNRREKLTGIGLRHRIVKRLRRIIRKQEEYARAKREHDKIFLEAVLPGSPLRGAPSGTPVQDGLKAGGIHLVQCPPHRQSALRSGVQYLTNQKPPYSLSGALSI